ncbi:hypothetical protein DEU37_1898 [Microbacterium sp. AG790]|nr:hypothetical protein DEU37_1898 [Microbacterium sp. AG790]
MNHLYAPDMDATPLLISVVALAISLAIMYLVIRNAVTAALRQARREQFTEDFYPEKAMWLTIRQREQLTEHVARRDAA